MNITQAAEEALNFLEEKAIEMSEMIIQFMKILEKDFPHWLPKNSPGYRPKYVKSFRKDWDNHISECRKQFGNAATNSALNHIKLSFH